MEVLRHRELMSLDTLRNAATPDVKLKEKMVGNAPQTEVFRFENSGISVGCATS
jgi:hypothetical protein